MLATISSDSYSGFPQGKLKRLENNAREDAEQQLVNRHGFLVVERHDTRYSIKRERGSAGGYESGFTCLFPLASYEQLTLIRSGRAIQVQRTQHACPSAANMVVEDVVSPALQHHMQAKVLPIMWTRCAAIRLV